MPSDDLSAEVEALREKIRLLANEMVYRGNSVAFIYQKKDAYAKGLDDAWKALKELGVSADGKTSLADAIRALRSPEDQGEKDRKDAERYRWLREHKAIQILASFGEPWPIGNSRERLDKAIDSTNGGSHG